MGVSHGLHMKFQAGTTKGRSPSQSVRFGHRPVSRCDTDVKAVRVGFFRYVGALRRVAISGVLIVSADLGGNLFDG